MKTHSLTDQFRRHLLLLLSLVYLLFSYSTAYADGTKQVSPTNSQDGAALLATTGSGGAYLGTGSYFGCPNDNRIRIRIGNDVTENLYFGFNPRNYAGAVVTNGFYRIFDQNGNPVVPATAIPSTGNGFISTYAQAAAGPNIGGTTPAGYIPLLFDPGTSGDFYIELYRSNDGGATAVTGTAVTDANASLKFPFFDFTVSTASNTQSAGRLFCRKWSFVTCDLTNLTAAAAITYSFTGDFYCYTPDKFILQVFFEAGFRPVAFDLAMNFTGVTNTGTFTTDRRSSNTIPTLTNGYQIFLTSPDPGQFPNGVAGTPAFTSDIYGCPGAYFIPFVIDQPGDVSIVLDLNGTTGYQSGTSDVILEAYNLTAGNQVISWNGLNGLGVAVPVNVSTAVTVTLFQGRTNVPMIDAELNTNGFSVKSIFPALGNRKLYWDDASLTIIGTCGAATDNTCTAGINNSNLGNGTAGPNHAWDGNAPSTTVPAASGAVGSSTPGTLCDDYGNSRCINTWFYAAEYASPPTVMTIPGCDPDGDGISNSADLDDDNDGISDLTECTTDPMLDADADGVPNYVDPQFAGFVDVNSDGVDDVFDFDLDGNINCFDLDADGDGITDLIEAGKPDANGNGQIDGFTDVNANGLSDAVDPNCNGVLAPKGATATAGTTGTVNNTANAVDASNTTFAAITTNNGTIDIDFGSLLPAGTVITVNISSSAAAATNGNIQRSADDATYAQSQAYSVNTNTATGTAQTYTLGAAARYIRITRTSAANNTQVHIATYPLIPCNGVIGTAIVPVNTDGTGGANYKDIDSDGDGIVDNIEAQSTAGYVAPSGTDTDNDGLDNAYDGTSGFGGAGVTPVNTESADNPDYTDLNSDNDTFNDAVEGWDTDNDNVANTTAAGTDSDNDGLDNAYDVNDTKINPANGQTPSSFPNLEITATTERDWREADNEPPVLDNETQTISEGATATGDLTDAGDSDPDGTALTANTTPVVAPVNGGIVVNANGTYTYTPNPNYNGSEQIVISICDAGTPAPNKCVNDTINITITPVNSVPVLTNDATTIAEDNVASGDITTGGDSDPDGTALTVNTTPVSGPSHGVIALNTDGTYTYTPAADYNGTDVVTIQVCDGDTPSPSCSTETLTITITPVNDVPVLADDATTIAEDGTDSGDITNGSDSDPDGTTLVVNTTPVSGPLNGNIVLNTDGTYTYTPIANFNGTDVITIQVCDGDTPMPSCSTETLTITITAVNDAPVAVDNSTSTNEDTPVTLTAIQTNDSDVDGTVVTASIDLDPVTAGQQTSFTNTSGMWSVNTTSGDVLYTPAADFNGTASINYTINDNNGQPSNPAVLSVNVTAVNDAPVANNDSGTINEDAVGTLPVIGANDTDVDGTVDPFTIDLDPVTPGQQTTLPTTDGTWAADASGNVTFTPAADFNGTTAISYTINDDSGTPSNPASLSFTVNPVNDVPQLDDDFVTVTQNASAGGDVTDTGDFDPDGTALTATVTPVSGPANGVIIINTDGTFTYTPTVGYSGSDQVVVEVCDAGTPLPGACSTETIFFTVTLTIPPVANDDNPSTTEDTPTSFNVTTNDSDPDGTVDASTVDLDPSTAGIQAIFTNAAGTWTVDASGNVSYTPAADFNGSATLNYTVNDNLGATSNQGTITVAVAPVNDAPVLTDDTATIAEDGTASGDVTNGGDSDPDGTALTVNTTPVSGPSNGNIILNTDGTYTYTPNADFNGTDVVTIQVCDAGTPAPGICKNETLTITITAVNDAPVANDDSPTTNEDTPITVDVTTNDTDVDGTIDPATVDLDPATPGIQNTYTTPAGTWAVDAAGNVTFTPVADYNGNASITYTVNDDGGTTSNAGTISITITPVTDPPVANNDNPVTNEDMPVTVNVTTNDVAPDGTIDAATVDLDPATPGIQNTFTTPEGTWTVDASGNVTFTPAADFNGTAAVTYTVNDNNGTTSNTGTIAVTVNPVIDQPIANTDSPTGNEGSPVTVNVTTNDVAPDGTIDAATVDLDPSTPGIQATFTTPEGTWTVDGTGTVTFTPNPGFNGTATVTYVVNDNNGTTSNPGTISVTVNPVNDAPVLTDDTNTILEDGIATGDVTDAGDADPDGTALTVNTTPVSGPSNGNIVLNSDGTYTYTPNADFNGTDVITISVCDAGTPLPAKCATETLTITVTAVNDTPVVDDETITVGQNTSYSGDVTGTGDADPDGTTLTTNTTPVSGPSNGSIVVNADGTYTYTPNTGYNGPDQVVVQICDAGTPLPAICVNINININVISTIPPVAVDDNTSTNEDTPVTVNVTTNDSDPDGTVDVTTVDLDPATPGIQNTFPNSSGTWSVDATGKVTFTPVANFNGTATVTYTVNDNLAATSNVATLTVNVISVNDVPVAGNDNATTNEDTPVTVNVTTNDTDADGTINASTVDLDPSTPGITEATFTNASGTWTVDASGNVTLTPAANFNGTATVTYTVKDNGGATSNTGTLTINVTPVNDAPVAGNDNATTNEDTPVTVNVTTNDSDPDGTVDVTTVDLDPATPGIQNTFPNASGIWSVDITGKVTFTPAANFNGTATVTYTVNDNSGTTSNVGTISITVTSVNDAPVANDDNPVANEDTPLTVNVTANDTDVDGTIDAATVDLDPATPGIQNTFTTPEGTWTVDASGNVTYTPAANFNGTATITYTVNDNGGTTSNVGTITVTVTAVNDAPSKGNEHVTTNQDAGLPNINVTANNTDPEGDPLTVTAGGTSENGGTVVVNSDGSITYTPAPGYFGKDTVIYTVCDNAAIPACVQDTLFINVQQLVDTDGDGIPDITDLDDDNDGIPDTVEAATASNGGDSDGDGIPDGLDLDSDNDGIPDVIEAGGSDPDGDGVIGTGPIVDTDGDGISDIVDATNGGTPLLLIDTDGDGHPDFQDKDSDNDGIPDVVEAGNPDVDGDGEIDNQVDANHDGRDDTRHVSSPVDTDGDGVPNYKDLDSDNDGIPDVTEGGNADTDGDGKIDNPVDADGDGRDDTHHGTAKDTDGDNVPDYTDLDSDNDGIPDVVEGGNPDTDGDGKIDGFTDPDGNGRDDTHKGTGKDTDGDGVPDFKDLDSDNDGIPDVTEGGNPDTDGDGKIDGFSDPDGNGRDDSHPGRAKDTDGDGVPDFKDLDSDNDGIPDVVEGGNPDTNGDGKVDGFSDPDGNGRDDGHPGKAIDTDGDGVPDFTDLDSDNDGIPDVEEGGNPDTNGDGKVDGFSDPDGNGRDDGHPGKAIDTDGDGVPDFKDPDSDNDGIPDVIEGGNTDTNGDGKVDGFSDPDGNGRDDGHPGKGIDTDGDGIPDFKDPDSDGDGVPDGKEYDPNGDGKGPDDTDGDGTPDFRDNDDDGDGIPSLTEATQVPDDCDGDGIPNYLDSDRCTTGVVIPSAFSPDGDNVNDLFIIEGIENFPDNTLVIFNRWGNEVLNVARYDNTWGGVSDSKLNIGNGEKLPTGTYYYVFDTGTEQYGIVKGYIYLKR